MASTTGSAKPQLFARKASGLIRQFGFKDVFVFNTLGYALGLVLAVTPFFAGSVFPGRNVLIVLVIGTIMAAFNGLTYSLLAGAMPRSGGEYVYNGRVLHPAIGFMTNWGFTWSQLLGIAIYVQWTINYAISVSASTIGYSSNNQFLLDVASWVAVPRNTFMLGTLLLVIVIIVQLAGMGVLKRLLNWLFIVAMLGSILTAIVFLMHDHSSFVAAFNSFMSKTTDTSGAYDAVLSQAKEGGWSSASSPWYEYIIALPLAYWMFIGFTYSAYIGGEVKEPQKTQSRAVMASLLVGFLFYFVILGAYYRTVGTQFNDAAAFLQFNGNSPLPVAGVLNFFAGVLTTNVIINTIIGLSFFLWHFLLLFVMFTIIVRNMFAWSFDQIIPAKLTTMTKRTLAPWAAIVTASVVIEILLALFTFTTLFSYVYNYIVIFSVAFWFTSFAAILLPYRRKDLFDAAPPAIRRRVFGVPLVTIAGVLNLILFTLILYASFKLPAFSGPTGKWATIFVIAIYVVGLAIYFAVSAFKKRKGVDLSLLYGEIPPE
jgi:APA family basic amino acid/polyamine antiporter